MFIVLKEKVEKREKAGFDLVLRLSGSEPVVACCDRSAKPPPSRPRSERGLNCAL
jgi:hypothetical protein